MQLSRYRIVNARGEQEQFTLEPHDFVTYAGILTTMRLGTSKE